MSSTEPVPPPLPQESDEKPAERRFPWPIWVVAGLVYAFFLTVAIRVGDDVPYQAGKYLGSMGIAVLASWGLWRLASRATGAAWGGLLLGVVLMLFSDGQTLRREREANDRAIAAYSEAEQRVNSTAERFFATGGLDLSTLEEGPSLEARRDLLVELRGLLEDLERDLRTGDAYREALRAGNVDARRIEVLVPEFVTGVAKIHGMQAAYLSWCDAALNLLELAQQHRDLWSLDSDGALVVSEGADPKIDAQFDDAVAEVGTTWDLLEQRSAAFAEWQQSIGGPR